MKRYIYIVIALLFLAPSLATAESVNLSNLTADGVAIYGWHNGIPTLLYGEKEKNLFPIASITKLITAKAVETLYTPASRFTISQDALTATSEDNGGIVPGMVFSRDDMLKALLVSSNNALGKQFAQAAAPNVFINTMNSFLHTHKYTATNFINPTGLDPDDKKVLPNRLTAKSLSYLISDIYRTDPLLTEILKQKNTTITDLRSGIVLPVDTTNKINRDPLYSTGIILSKTGVTARAGQAIVFITSGENKFDYITVVLLHSKDRYTDGIMVLNWLQQVLHFQL